MKLYPDIAPVFRSLVTSARYKAAFGGRGSGKSHFFASLVVAETAKPENKGMRIVCIREFQKSLKESNKRGIEDKLLLYGLGEADGYRVYEDRIATPGDGVIIFVGMNNQTAESIKSLEGYSRAWVEEAQTFSQKSLDLLRPTIREPGSEIWFSWNPTRRTDPVDAMFRTPNAQPTNALVVEGDPAATEDPILVFDAFGPIGFVMKFAADDWES
jgi:phage terminase large subunit